MKASLLEKRIGDRGLLPSSPLLILIDLGLMVDTGDLKKHSCVVSTHQKEVKCSWTNHGNQFSRKKSEQRLFLGLRMSLTKLLYTFCSVETPRRVNAQLRDPFINWCVK